MLFENYVKTKKGQKACVDIPYFCGACVESCDFLIDKYGFEKAEIDLVGREYQVQFKKADLTIGFSYEMGNLPQLSVLKSSKELSLESVDKGFSENAFLSLYGAHRQIRAMLNCEYSSTNDYTSAISNFWSSNKKEIMAEVEKHVYYLCKVLRKNLSKVLNYEGSEA